MLVLSRKENERIQIGEEIFVTIAQIKGNRVSVGIDAPSHIRIRRGELPTGSTKRIETDQPVGRRRSLRSTR